MFPLSAMNTPALPAMLNRARRNGLGDLLWRSARRVPGKLALAYRDRHWSYAELDAAVNRVANALLARGIAKGERGGGTGSPGGRGDAAQAPIR